MKKINSEIGMTKVKIAFIGTHSTGKTIRAEKISAEKGLVLLTGMARSCPLPINEVASKEAQLYIWSRQLSEEIRSMALSDRGIVCDRSLLDSLVYAYDRGYEDIVENFLPFTRKWMNTYTELYWCRPAPGTTPEKDGVRSDDWIWQQRIDRQFALFIEDILSLEVEEISSVE